MHPRKLIQLLISALVLAMSLLSACTGNSSRSANALVKRYGSGSPAQVTVDPNNPNQIIVEAVLTMEIFHKDPTQYYESSQVGEVPFSYSNAQGLVNKTGEGKLIETFTRPVIGNAPGCNLYVEAKLLLTLEGELSLTNGPRDDTCRLKGTLTQTPVEPTWSGECPTAFNLKTDVYVWAYSRKYTIDLPVFNGASSSTMITSLPVQETPSGDQQVRPNPLGEDQDILFTIKNLNAPADFCKVPTPTPAP